MDFYQGVVVDYLRPNRATFVNTEYCIPLNPGTNPDTSGPHWYCDAVALDCKAKTVFLCEISFETRLSKLAQRLKAWHENWDSLCEGLRRDSYPAEIGGSWPVRPWLFIPGEFIDHLTKALDKIIGNQQPKFSVSDAT